MPLLLYIMPTIFNCLLTGWFMRKPIVNTDPSFKATQSACQWRGPLLMSAKQLLVSARRLFTSALHLLTCALPTTHLCTSTNCECTSTLTSARRLLTSARQLLTSACRPSTTPSARDDTLAGGVICRRFVAGDA